MLVAFYSQADVLKLLCSNQDQHNVTVYQFAAIQFHFNHVRLKRKCQEVTQ